MKTLIAILLFSGLALAQTPRTCPLGEREDHLTFQRVMRNFGRFTMPADVISLQGSNGEIIEDAKLADAIAKLELVVFCANAVIASPRGELLPREMKNLQGPELAQAVAHLTDYMKQFRGLILEYRGLLVQNSQRPKNNRDFKPALAKSRQIDTFVTRAHGELTR